MLSVKWDVQSKYCWVVGVIEKFCQTPAVVLVTSPAGSYCVIWHCCRVSSVFLNYKAHNHQMTPRHIYWLLFEVHSATLACWLWRRRGSCTYDKYCKTTRHTHWRFLQSTGFCTVPGQPDAVAAAAITGQPHAWAKGTFLLQLFNTMFYIFSFILI